MDSKQINEITYASTPTMQRSSLFFHLAFRDLLNSVTLGFILMSRDIRSQYRQSLCGIVWALLPPLILTLAFLLLKNANVIYVGDTSNGIETFVLIGNTLWQGFADALSNPLKAIHAGKSLLSKVSFPREAILLAGLLEVLFYFLIRLLIVIPVVFFMGTSLSFNMLAAPIGMLATIALGWAIGLMLIPLGSLYKDVELGLGLIAPLIYFITPAIYSPSWRLTSWLPYNPLSTLIDATREVMINKAQWFSLEVCLILFLAFSTIIVAWILFRLAIPHLTKRLQA